MAKRATGSVDRDKRRGGWFARVGFTTSDGKRHETRVNATTQAKAGDARDKILADLRQFGPDDYLTRKAAAPHPLDPLPVARLDGSEKTFGELAEYYKREYAKPVKVRDGRRFEGLSSWKRVHEQVKLLESEIGASSGLSSVTFDRVRELRSKRLDTPVQLKGWEKARERSIANVNRLLATLRRMLKIAVRLKWMTSNPFDEEQSAREKLIAISLERPRDRVMSPSEERALLKQLGGRYRRRSLPVVLMLIDTGARAGEILRTGKVDEDTRRRVRWSDVDFAAKGVKLYASKSEHEREVGLTPRLEKALRTLHAKMAGAVDGEVFGHVTYSVVRDDFEAACAAASITGLRLHDLRHTRATRWIQGGLMESEVAHLLGHSKKSQVTRRYINPDAQTITRSLAADLKFSKEHGRKKTRAEAVN